jgi:hypothetical protein
LKKGRGLSASPEWLFAVVAIPINEEESREKAGKWTEGESCKAADQ